MAVCSVAQGKKRVLFWLLLFLSTTVGSGFASDKNSPWEVIKTDYSNFYSKNSLLRLGLGFLAMGIVANSELDENFQDWYQDEVRSDSTDDFSEITKLPGEGKYLLPAALLSSGLYYLDPDSSIGKWGLNATRAYLVGLPPMWVMQHLTGASRPDNYSGSDWDPFNDENGVSGHAFVGAVPFLTVAMMNDNIFIKYLSYFASTLTAVSRINDNDHFLSQSVLGWYMAYESVNAVFKTDKETRKLAIIPLINRDMYGVVFNSRW